MRGAEGDVAIPKGFRHPETRCFPENPGGIATPVCALVRNDIKLVNNNLQSYLHHSPNCHSIHRNIAIHRQHLHAVGRRFPQRLSEIRVGGIVGM